MSYGFVKVPNMWRRQLRKVKARGTTYHVAMVILEKARWSEWVTLSNGVAGVDRHAKCDALKQLRTANLVIMEERKGKSPYHQVLLPDITTRSLSTLTIYSYSICFSLRNHNGGYLMAEKVVVRIEEDDRLLREWTFPEEDRHLYTSEPWTGGYRWFRSLNVICFERTKRRRKP